MKRSTKIIIGTVIGVGLVGAVTAKQFGSCEYGGGYGHRGHFSKMEHGGRHMDRMAQRITKKLDLNTEQQAELDKLKTSIFDSVQDMRSQKPDASEIQALLNNEFDQTKAMQLIEQRGQVLKETAPQIITAFAQFYDQLNAEQQAKVSEMVEYRMSHREHKWGGRGKTSYEAGDNR